MTIEFIADSPNPKSQIRPFRERFWSLAGQVHQLDIAVGYVDVASLVELNDYLSKNSNVRLNLLVGMQYFDGFTHPQLSALQKLSSHLTAENLGDVFISNRVKYHGKIYAFGAGTSHQRIYVGSGNLSSISQSYSATYEAGVLLESGTQSIIDYLRSTLFPLASPFSEVEIKASNRDLVSPLEKMDQVEKLDENVPFELTQNLSPSIRFSIPIKPTDKSNLNVFFGKGRYNTSSGRTLARPWYEAELIPGFKITRNKRYPQNRAEFNVVTDNGYQFKCNVSGSEGNKNLRSSGSLSILGAYLKGHLEAFGLLKPGEKVTADMLIDYGREVVDLLYFEESDRWIMDFRPGVTDD